MTGAVLLAGFAVEGVTILEIHRLIWLHFVVGFLLIGPVLLKICSTGYRFARYYLRSEPYRRKGPPAAAAAAPRTAGDPDFGGGARHGRDARCRRAWRSGKLDVPAQGVVRAVVRRHDNPRGRVRTAAATAARGRPARPGPAAAPGGAARYLALGGALAGGILVAALAMHLSGQWGGGFSLH